MSSVMERIDCIVIPYTDVERMGETEDECDKSLYFFILPRLCPLKLMVFPYLRTVSVINKPTHFKHLLIVMGLS